MHFLTFLFAALATFKVGSSLPVEEELVPVDLAHICLEVETDEAKSPILLIHGLLDSKETWSGLAFLLAFRTKRKVCAVDLRNHGDSPWNKRNDVEILAADIGYFLDKQGIKKVNLIGHSLGGKTSIHYALKNPDRVDSIVVEDIRPNTVVGDDISLVTTFLEILDAAVESVPAGATESEAKKSIKTFINKKLEEIGSKDRVPDAFLDSMKLKLVDGKWRLKHNIKVLGDSMKDFKNFWTQSTGLYNGPILFVYGTESPFKVNEDKDNILKLFPNAEFVPVEGAGHVIHGVYSEFDDAVIKFLNKKK